MAEQERKRREGEKLDAEMSRVGLPGERRGDMRDRAEVLGVKPLTITAWIKNRNPVPDWVWNFLKCYELLSAEQRETFKRWARDRAKKKS